MPTPDERWADDSIQFPRLICEILANCEITESDWELLCESMDLTPFEVAQLTERAHHAWERAKASARG